MRPSAILLAATAVSAGPVLKRVTLPNGDIDILNYALTLEYLERKFYQEGLKNYTEAQFAAAGFNSDVYAKFKTIRADEESHVSFLAGALGPAAVGEPTFKFPSTDVASFVGLAGVLEGVGVSAYLGAAASIVDKTYLTVAGSILTVEARHASYVRNALKQEPFPKPYDTPLDFNYVFSLAAQFITGNAPNLPFKAFPPLTLRASQYAYTEDRSSVTFDNAFVNAQALQGKNITKDTKVYAAFSSGLDTYYVPVYITQGNKDYKVEKIPGASQGQLAPLGQTYVVLTTADGVGENKAKDENIISGVGILEVLKK